MTDDKAATVVAVSAAALLLGWVVKDMVSAPSSAQGAASNTYVPSPQQSTPPSGGCNCGG